MIVYDARSLRWVSFCENFWGYDLGWLAGRLSVFRATSGHCWVL